MSKISKNTISDSISKLNTDYFLPALQRDFVWSTQQICALFDSILQEYPISTFLFWEIPSQDVKQFEVYSFLWEIRKTNNQPTKVTNFLQKNITFVLDGQQRLTSLNIGLNGNFITGKRSANIQGESLYFDVLHNPSDLYDHQDGYKVKYKFEFRQGEGYSSKNSGAEYWIKVPDFYKKFYGLKDYVEILNNFSEVVINKIRPARIPSQGDIANIKCNLEKLHKALFLDEVIITHTEIGNEHSRMLDIFMRANNGGTPLKNSDLLLSTFTLHWNRTGESGKEEVKKLCDEIGDLIDSKNTAKDFIMKACLVLTDEDVAYKLKNFTKDFCEKVCDDWPKIREAITNTIKLVSSFGVTKSNLSSVNALLPIAFFLYKQNKHVDYINPDTDKESHTSLRIKTWLIGALLNGVFSGSSDSMIQKLRTGLKASRCETGVFDIFRLDEDINDLQGNKIFVIETIERIFINYDYKSSQSKCSLALLMINDAKVNNNPKGTIDHLFSQNEYKKFSGRKDSEDKVHHIANLTLMTGRKNSQKKDRSLSDWLKDKNTDVLNENLIPIHPGNSSWNMSNFSDFINAREKIMKKAYVDLFEKVKG